MVGTVQIILGGVEGNFVQLVKNGLKNLDGQNQGRNKKTLSEEGNPDRGE